MKNNVKSLVLTAFFAATTCVLAQISITLPFSPVPFTLSLVAVFVSGAFLSPVWAFLSQLVYLALGAVGLPVFAGFGGGLAKLVGPTGGFLLAYPIMAIIVSLFIYTVKPGKLPVFLRAISGMLLSIIICYIIGTAMFCFSTGSTPEKALPLVALPFIPLDCVKAVLSSLLFIAVNKRMKILGK